MVRLLPHHVATVPMKKFLPVLVVLLALGAAGATVFLYQKPGVGGAGSAASAGYLPAETLLLLSVPDPQQTAADWKTTDLYKIWSEPSVQAFLAKPLAKIPPNKDVDDTLAQIERVNPHHLFVALTALDEKNNKPHGLAGFQFRGTNAEVEQLLGKPKEALRGKNPAGKADLVKYQDHSLETFTDPDGDTIASVYVNDWYFVSNDLALLEATLDRVDHRAPAGAPTLESDPDFKTVLAKMPAHPATLIFAKPRIFFDRIFALAATSGQTVSEEQLAEIRKIKAVGATTSIDNGKLRDTIYSLAPGYKLSSGTLQMSALPLTSANTLLFYAGMLQIPEHLDIPKTPGGGPNAMGYALLGQYAKQMQERGLTVENFNTAFGHELSFQLDWPAASNQPTLVLSLDVRDPAASAKFLDSLIKLAPWPTVAKGAKPDDATALSWQLSDADGFSYRSLSIPNVNFASPTLTLTDKHLIVGLSMSGVHDAVAHEKTGGANFTAGEAYKTAAATVGKPNFVTTYLDTKPLFERTYAALKPLALFGAAFAGPQVNDYVDLGKLPDGDAIAKHLTPIVLSEKADDQGILMESVGPVTFIQASAGFGVVAGAAAIPMLQKQIAAGLGKSVTSPKNGADDAADAPESTPDASPQPTAGQ